MNFQISRGEVDLQTRRRRTGFAIAKLVLAVAAVTILRSREMRKSFLEGFMDKQAKVVQLKTQLVKEGHTRAR